MTSRLAGAVRTGRAVVDLARRQEVTFLAAAIAYYGLVSVVPALLLALVVAVLVGGPDLAERLLAVTATVLTPAARSVIGDALVGAGNRGGVTVLGVAVLTWGALKGFRGLDRAFSVIYESSGELTLAEGLVNAVAGLVGVGVAFVLMVTLGGVLAALPIPVAGWVIGLAVLLVGLFVAFLPLYVRFPGRKVRLREAAPGAAVAAVGWVALQTGFQLYAAVTSVGDLYGVLGGVLLVVTWFYLAAILILLGAVLNVVLGGRDPAPDRQAEESGGPADRPRMDGGTDDDASLEERVAELREAVEALEDRLEAHTVPRAEVESDLRRYVRTRIRRGHARGWGPYLVLLYGTAMTLGAFYLLSGGWAILAMVVVWLSTLGLYVLMLLAGVAVGAAGLPGRAVDAVRDRRS